MKINLIKKIFIGVIAYFGIIFTSNADVTKLNYPTPGYISIIASSPFPDGVAPTVQGYKDLVDCGFNVGISRGSVSYFRDQFILIGNLDFKYIISSVDLMTPNKAAYTKAFKNNKKLAGWCLKDEPQFSILNDLSTNYKALKREDPKHLILVNLVGVIEKAFTGNLKKFSDYLNLIQEKISPDVWSYDYYPIIVKGGRLIVEYDQFYSDLEDFSAMSKKTGKPFWAFCESMAYKTRSYSRPEGNEAYFSFEAFSALAYGAQGIIYWTYGLRNSNSVESYTTALVDLKGNKTKSWYAAQKVNKAIKKFNHVFYESNVLDVKHTGSNIYKGTKKLSGTFGPFKSVKSGNAGVLASYIENKGRKFIVFVNHDVSKTQSLNLTLTGSKKVINISSANETYSGTNEIKLTLSAGGYIILEEVD